MPSSTSSSERPLPAGPWGRTWLLAAAVFVTLVGLLEWTWRARGFVPSVVDDKELWAYERGRIGAGSPETLVLVGTSMLQLDIDTDVLRARLPGHRIVQLAIAGHKPLATLKDLADDPDFRAGVVLVDVVEPAFERRNFADQSPWVRHYHARTGLTADLERWLSRSLQSRLVSVHPDVSLVRVLAAGKAPEPSRVTTLPDRSRRADFRGVDLARAQARRIARERRRAPALAPKVWLREAQRAIPWVRELGKRGVKVVFVVMPRAGEHWTIDATRYPRAQYWDRLAPQLGVPTIHFKDHPELDQFELPDTSHLDQRDAGRFTDCLVDVLLGLRILDSRAPSTCPR